MTPLIHGAAEAVGSFHPEPTATVPSTVAVGSG
jgi:hypothetical protein